MSGNSLQQKEISRPFVNSPKPLESANVNQAMADSEYSRYDFNLQYCWL